MQTDNKGNVPMDPEIYRLVADTTYDWEELLDPQGNYMYVSPSSERITGYRAEEFIAKPVLLLEITHPDDRAALEGHYRTALDGTPGACKLEFRITCRDGKERWIEHCCRPIYHADGSPLGHRGSNRDITSIKRNDKALRQNEAQLRMFMHHIPGIIGVVDQTGTVTLIEGSLETLGFDPKTLIGLNVFEALIEWPHTLDEIRRALNGEPITFSTVSTEVGTHLALRYAPIQDENGQITSVLVIATDITERKKSEDELRQSAETIKALINAPTDLALLLDVEGRILIANDALARIVGDSTENLVGERIWDLFPPHASEYRKSIFEQVLQTGQVSRVDDKNSINPDETVIFDTIVFPIFDASGQVSRVAILARDITERVRAERILQQKDALLNNLILNAPVTFLTVDNQGKITMLAGEELSHFGIDPDSYIGQDISVFENNRPDVVANIHKAIQGDEISELVEGYDRQIYETRYAPIRDNQGNIAGGTGVGINVTEYTQTREELQQSKEQLEVILQGIQDGVHVWDASGELIYANQGTAWLKNYLSKQDTARFEQIAQDIEVLDEAGLHIPREQLPGALARKGIQAQPRLVRLRNRRLNEERWAILKSNLIYDENGAMRMAVVITQDITELKNAETALRESEVLYRTLVDTSPDGIVLVDLKGHLLKANQQFAEIFGFDSPEELIASYPQGFDLTIEEDKARIYKNIQKAFEEGPIRQTEYTARRKDGSLFPIEISGAVILGMAGTPGTLVGICRDITDRKKAQQEVKEANEKLEQRVRERTAELAEANRNLRAENIERQRAEAKSRRHAAHMESLALVAARINAQLDLQTVLQAICEEAVRAVPGMPGAILRLYDEASDQIYPAAAHGPFSEHIERIPAFPRGLHDSFIPTSEPVMIVPDIQEFSSIPGIELYSEWQVRSIVNINIMHDDDLVGTLNMASFGETSLPTADERAFLQALAEQAAVAITNARLFEQVSASRQRLQALSKRLVEIQEAERRRLARELHDEIGSTLTSLNINLDLTRRSIKSEERTLTKVQDQLAQTQEQLKQLMQQVRNLSLDLRPGQLDYLGLLPALFVHFERYTEQTGIQVDFKHSGVEGRFSPEIETTAFRVIQEALTNVARHTGVDAVIVRLWANEQILGLQVEDQGAGFDPKAAIKAGETAGISGMYERVTSCGGDIEFESQPGHGTILTVELPLTMQSLQEKP